MKNSPKKAETNNSFKVEEKDNKFTTGWRHSFQKRFQSNIKTVTPRVLEPERAAVTKHSIDEFFCLVQDMYSEHKYDPLFISNFDESMVQVLQDRSKVVIPASCREGYVIDVTAPFHMTIGCCIFADGTSFKPLVILPLTNFPKNVPDEMVNAYAWSGQDAGWITAEIFNSYIQKVYIPELNKKRAAEKKPDARALLFVDGHSSRRDPATLELLRAANVDVITFVAHASHLLQPLDRWLFLLFKSQLSTLRRSLRNASRPDQRLAMLDAVQRAIHNATMPQDIIKSFSLSGLYPFNPDAVFPVDNATPDTSNAPTSKKRHRNSVNINNTVLTSDEILRELYEEKSRKEAKRAAKKQKKTFYNITIKF